MTRRAGLPAVCLAAIFISAGVEAAPATAPVTMPTSQPTTAPVLPAEFQLFQQRSAFAPPGANLKVPGSTGGIESQFVLRGIGRIGDQFTALIENTEAKDVSMAKAGDAVASGKVKSIDLDTLEFESAGQSRRIGVGQNLNGEVVASEPATKPAAPAPPAGADAPAEQGDQPASAPPQQSKPKPRRNK